MIDEWLKWYTYTVAYEDVSVDPELYNLATDHLTLHLFNDYKKSKEKTKDNRCRSIWRTSGKNTVDKINQPYGDKMNTGNQSSIPR